MTHIASMERKEGMIMLEVYTSQLMPNSPQKMLPRPKLLSLLEVTIEGDAEGRSNSLLEMWRGFVCGTFFCSTCKFISLSYFVYIFAAIIKLLLLTSVSYSTHCHFEVSLEDHQF